jgi:uncharacterized membrane protein
MEIRKVDAGQGWRWIAGGFGLFRKNPPIWMVFAIIYVLIVFFLLWAAPVGVFLLVLVSPVIDAGFMVASRTAEKGEDLEISLLFAGFKHRSGQLVTVGGLYLIGAIIIAGLMMMAGGGAILGSAALGQMQGAAPTEVMVGAMGGMLISLLVTMALLIPLKMASWFAPALVMFHNMTAVEAMKLSFFGCLRNMWPFLVYGVIFFILMMIAMIPFGLGMLILVPVLNASIYLGYKDIFPAEPEPEAELPTQPA